MQGFGLGVRNFDTALGWVMTLEPPQVEAKLQEMPRFQAKCTKKLLHHR